MEDKLNLEVSEISLELANKKYAVYPKIEVVESEYPLDIITYVVTDNGYLAPLRLRLGPDAVMEIHDITNFMLEIVEACETIKENFQGWSHFKGKSNYIYEDGIIISTFKIKEN